MSFYFDGVDDYLYLAGAPAGMNTLPFTMAFWGRLTDPLTLSEKTGFCLSKDNTVDFSTVGVNADGYARGSVRMGVSLSYASNTEVLIEDSDWHCFSYTIESDTSKLAYLDGGSEGANTLDPGTFTGAYVHLAIGAMRRTTVSNYWKGYIAHVAGWSVRLTAGEMTKLAAGANPQTIRPDALVFYEPLLADEGAMTIIGAPVFSANNNPPVAPIGPTAKIYSNNDIQAGIFTELTTPNGFYFDGNTSNASLTVATPILNTPLSVAAWFKPDGDWTGDGEIIGIANNEVDTSQLLQMYLSTDTFLKCITRGTTIRTAASTTPVKFGQWNHGVAIVNTLSDRSIYLNGGGLGTDTSASTPSEQKILFVGRHMRLNPGSPFKGSIAHTAVWNIALTATDVENLNNGVLPSHVQSGNLVWYEPLTIDAGSLTVNNGASVLEGSSVPWNTIDGPLMKVCSNNTLQLHGLMEMPVASAKVDNVTDVLERYTNIPNARTGASVSGWLYRNGTRAAISNIVEIQKETTTSRSVYIQITANDAVCKVGYFSDGGGGVTTNFDSVPSPNTWIYFALSAEVGTGTVKGYWWDIDGNVHTAATNLPDTGTWESEVILLLTNSFLSDYHVNGEVCNFRSWDRVLTQAEFEEEMNSPYPVNMNGLNSAFTDDPLNDVSGNGNIFTATGVTSTANTPFSYKPKLYANGVYSCPSFIET